jgi:hypothetical protein
MSEKLCGLEAVASEMLNVLDDDAANLRATREMLNQLRGGVIKHDDAGLESLLAGMQSQQQAFRDVASRRQKIRDKAANLLTIPAPQVNLTALMTRLDEPLRNELGVRKRELEELIASVRAEYISTVTFVAECSRFNNMLLNGILSGTLKGARTYSPSGRAQMGGRSGLVNMRF